MNIVDAKKILSRELEIYKSMTYKELVSFIEKPIAYEKKGESGMKFQVEIQVILDNQPNHDIRVVGSIDDGSWRTFFPITDGFIRKANDDENYLDKFRDIYK